MLHFKKYCINYNYKLYEGCSFAIDNIDIFLSKDLVPLVSSSNPFMPKCDSIPQIKNNRGIINNYNWVKVNRVFQSLGNEEFVLIGNFENPNNINGININNDPIKISYYLFDDISVCECSFDINLGEDTTLCEGESLILNPNLPNATYTWQDSSHTTTYEVKQPGTYWVRAYVADYDITSTDTLVITAGDNNYCNPPLTIPNVITPNGDSQNDNFVIQNAETYEIALQIYNRWGNLIYETTNYQNDFSCKDCADGTYFYILKAKSKRNGREKEYKGSITIIK